MQNITKAGRTGESARRPAIRAKRTKSSLSVVFLYLRGLRSATSSKFLIVYHPVQMFRSYTNSFLDNNSLNEYEK